MNTRNLVTGIAFEVFAALLVFNIFTKELNTLTLLGAILFFALGIAYLRRVKEH